MNSGGPRFSEFVQPPPEGQYYRIVFEPVRFRPEYYQFVQSYPNYWRESAWGRETDREPEREPDSCPPHGHPPHGHPPHGQPQRPAGRRMEGESGRAAGNGPGEIEPSQVFSEDEYDDEDVQTGAKADKSAKTGSESEKKDRYN